MGDRGRLQVIEHRLELHDLAKFSSLMMRRIAFSRSLLLLALP